YHNSIRSCNKFNLFSLLKSTTLVNPAKKLYKYLLRQCDRLPGDPKKHYRFMIKQSFKQHITESDPDRIKQIIERSYADCEWILQKYLAKTSR
ncbi:LYR motif-containing protein 9-like, partial [Cylas formicarius]|uniref:LYR motif-containing protein 9-like n=1 Tax=Cylas formicarius TaxID=197179 RepID=UPI002958546B